MKFAKKRGPHIFQAPPRHHGIIAGDQKACQHTHVTDERPYRASCQLSVGPCRIRFAVTADNELTDHTGDA